jgi:flagellar biosynthesis/type III secretory pathway protein FliH
MSKIDKLLDDVAILHDDEVTEARTEAYEEGYEIGFEDGKQEGFIAGYEEAMKDNNPT